MATTYQIIDRFPRGYVTLPDSTNNDPDALVSGSQNVLVNDEEKIVTRKGYVLFGAENTALNAVESSLVPKGVWDTAYGRSIPLRAYDDELEAYFGTVDGDTVNAWKRVLDGWSSVKFVGDTWWDTTETLDLLLFVNGDSNIYEWNGAVAVVDSTSGGNSITKKGTTTWAENGFYTTRNKTLINTRTGNEHTYTGGETTTTLTGVNNTTGIQQGDVLVQKVVTNSNTPASGFDNDVLRVLNNQVFVGSNNDNEVFVSADDDFTDYTFSSPRTSGEGALLTLQDTTNAFARFDEVMVIFSGKSDIYRTEFAELEVGSSLAETLKIRKLKTSSNQSAQSQFVVTEIGDGVAFLTFEPTLRILTNIENIESPQIRTHSNPIKPDFDDEDWSNAQMIFDNRRLYLSAPANSRIYILEWRETADGAIQRFWQPPQVLPVRAWALIDDAIHGHSNGVPETYTLFSGKHDNGGKNQNDKLPINAIAKFAYNSFDKRANFKTFNEHYFEGFISSNTKIKVAFNYEFEGSKSATEKEIDGSNSAILFDPSTSVSLGQQSLGQQPLGGSDTDLSQNAKYRVIFRVPPQRFHEYQVVLSSNDVDQDWELIAMGANARLAGVHSATIKI